MSAAMMAAAAPASSPSLKPPWVPRLLCTLTAMRWPSDSAAARSASATMKLCAGPAWLAAMAMSWAMGCVS